MYQRYGDRVRFLTIYIKEAHPLDEWQMELNEKESVCYPQPRTLSQRVAIANDFAKRFHYQIDVAARKEPDVAGVAGQRDGRAVARGSLAGDAPRDLRLEAVSVQAEGRRVRHAGRGGRRRRPGRVQPLLELRIADREGAVDGRVARRVAVVPGVRPAGTEQLTDDPAVGEEHGGAGASLRG